ncbi:MAG TPA: ATP-binding cassette domain-containing protein [Roseiarcus sp.]|nr:ATP-binding cassette domain-containing protein [Roseiarcus sp.]
MPDRGARAPGLVEPNEIGPRTWLVELTGVTKAFGPTLASADIDFAVAASDVVGLVGGNGAGKSTLMRILCGMIAPTLGRVSFDGAEVSFTNYDAGAAQRRGIRMVHQELSLCATLTVAENFFIEAPQHGSARPGWRNFYRRAARAALDAVFPGNRIDADQRIDRLSIGERQMVEIARATATPGVRLIVLDEPTSALDLERSRQLRDYVRERARSGLAFIFISHKLHEIMDVASRVLVLRNGRVAWQGAASGASAGRLVELMGGEATAIHHRIEREASVRDEVVRVGAAFVDGGAPVSFRRGEIIGLAGLEGQGQKALLRAIYQRERDSAGVVTRAAPASFVSGDRQKEGVFPLWSVLANVSIGRVGPRPALGLVSDRKEREAARPAAERIRLDLARFDSRIGELSGGNQQKALVSRAVAAETLIVLLDDPTRGVDIATKQDFYRLCSELAREGRTLIWHTTEDAELIACDRVLVFANGKIVRELSGPALTEEAVVAASFSHLAATGPERGERRGGERLRLLDRLVDAAPLLGLALVLAVMIAANPSVASVFGIDLLLMPALSLVLVTEAQMFVVGGAEIDLGVGAFAGLVSVLSATLLYDRPALGALAIAAVVVAYAMIGAVIQSRKIPAIVVTLGASFIWLGIGYSIQPTPGGASPDWLSALTGWSIPHTPTSIVLIGAVAAVGALLDWAPLGVALRGFGANPAAMIASGWPALRYSVIRYLIAGLFSAAAGLSLTAINSSSDINSGNSYTLLSVAAVVMGGCALTGGIVAPVGAALGAVTLALIGALLGALGVSSDFNAAAQGAVLIGLLGMRHLADKSGAE